MQSKSSAKSVNAKEKEEDKALRSDNAAVHEAVDSAVHQRRTPESS